MKADVAYGLLLLSCVGSCDLLERDRPKEVVPVAKPGAAATSSSFDLTPHGGGAVLAWALSDRAEAVTLLRLDAQGAPMGATSLLPSAKGASGVYEVVAKEAKQHLAVAWVARVGDKSATFAALVDPTKPRAAKVHALGEAERRESRLRGWLAVAAAADGMVRVLHRGEREKCAAGSEGCAGFGFSELPSRRDLPQRPWLEVPRPCRFGAVSYAVVGSHWYYSVCSEEADGSKTTLFSIHFDPEYARADPVLESCTPLGLPVVDGRVWLVADCGGQRKAFRAALDDGPPELVGAFKPEVVCAEGTLSLGLGDLTIALSEPVDRLETLLPFGLAPIGSRAVWTGSAILVAHRTPTVLELRRYQCVDGRVVRTDSMPSSSSSRAR